MNTSNKLKLSQKRFYCMRTDGRADIYNYKVALKVKMFSVYLLNSKIDHYLFISLKCRKIDLEIINVVFILKQQG